MTEEPAQLFLVNVRKMTQRKYFDVSRNVLESKRLKVRRTVPSLRVPCLPPSSTRPCTHTLTTHTAHTAHTAHTPQTNTQPPLPSLESCDLSHTSITGNSVDILINRCPRLTTLNLKNCAMVTHVLEEDLPSSHFVQKRVWQQLRLSGSQDGEEGNESEEKSESEEAEATDARPTSRGAFALTWLDLESCPLAHFTEITLGLLPNLRHLNLAYTKVSGHCLSRLAACCPALESLNLTTNDYVTNDVCTTSFARLPRLTHLCLKHCHRVSDASLEQFLPSAAPGGGGIHLHAIDLSRNKNVTDGMLVQLLKRMSHSLTELKARDCEKIAFSRILLHVLVPGAMPRLRTLDLYNSGNRPGLTAQAERTARVFQAHTLVSIYQLLVAKPPVPHPALTSLDVGSSEINVRRTNDTHTTHDTRHTTHDTRHTTHDTRHTTHAH
jgi:hypothetical protein